MNIFYLYVIIIPFRSGGETVNLMHMKYALEVEKTRSISKAAESLYMGQPNLSRAIKELEESLGITIFNRTRRGIEPTEQGERFLAYARNIIAQVEEVEALCRREKEGKIRFGISVPGAGYIFSAFAGFSQQLSADKELELRCEETGAAQAVDNILNRTSELAIIRYRTEFEKSFNSLAQERDLCVLEQWDFNALLLMSREHPLANAERIKIGDLSGYNEIEDLNAYVPPMQAAEESRVPDAVPGRHIAVGGYAGCIDILRENLAAYMWSSPAPEQSVRGFGLVQRRCEDFDVKYRDVLVCRRDYKLIDIDNNFIEFLRCVRAEVSTIPVV